MQSPDFLSSQTSSHRHWYIQHTLHMPTANQKKDVWLSGNGKELHENVNLNSARCSLQYYSGCHRYSGNAVPTNYSNEGTPTTIFRHRYSDNAIPTKVFRQLYSDKGIPALASNTCDNVFRQTYSDPNKLGEVFRSITCYVFECFRRLEKAREG